MRNQLNRAMKTTTSRRPGRPVNEAERSRRRKAILESATRAFAEDGFAATDVRRIADDLGVGKGTIYRHFSTKEELFLATVDAAMLRLRQEVDEAADLAEAPLEQIAAGIRAYLAYFRNHPEVVELLIQERAHFRDRKQSTYFQHRQQGLARWSALYHALIDNGIVRPIAVESIIDVVSNVLYGTMFTNHFNGTSKSIDEQCQDVLDILLHGISAVG